MRLTLPYGNGILSAVMDWGRPLGVLDISDVPEIAGRDTAIRNAIERPIGLGSSIYQIVRSGERVAILVSDMFRQTCAHQILLLLLEGLNRSGVPDDQIIIVFATGTHRPPTAAEQSRIVGEGVYAQFHGRIFVHEPANDENLVYVGTTSRGTPVRVNRRVQECDRIIATGAVVLHYFAGYGGGRKSIVPGIAAVDTIAHNHALNLDPHADRVNPSVRIGALDGNPVAEDMLEATRFVKVDYVVNTVLNKRGEIAGIFAGEVEAAHRAAARFAYRLYAVGIRKQADLVIASSGGTRNFVQSHKALFNAYQAVKPDGRIILLTKSEEGLGGEQFAKWVRLGNREAIFAGLRKQSEINGQTALSTVQKGPITILVTELVEGDVALLQARKATSLADALTLARTELARAGKPEPTYYVMPSAAYTVPFLTP
ncbi:MAG: nickel-dependent lactate racemase [Candidatus Hydrogenedentes bacterium]|nr:nickel-dependent lactate racemase [Candidatus Hydrogenedentota bacterium]